MKSVSNDYKEQLTALGRQYNVLVNYTVNGTNHTLSNSELNIVTPHYEGDLLKSTMKQLDLDSNVDIPIGTEINCQFGLLVGNDYEYIDYGNYIVYSSEKQEDLKSYKIVCYDKMLNAMKDYQALQQGKNLCDNSFINGNINYNGTANRIVSSNDLWLKSGTYTISTNLDLTAFKYAIITTRVVRPTTAGNIKTDSGWKTANYTLTLTSDSYLYILVAYSNGTTNLTPTVLNGKYFQNE